MCCGDNIERRRKQLVAGAQSVEKTPYHGFSSVTLASGEGMSFIAARKNATTSKNTRGPKNPSSHMVSLPCCCVSSGNEQIRARQVDGETLQCPLHKARTTTNTRTCLFVCLSVCLLLCVCVCVCVCAHAYMPLKDDGSHANCIHHEGKEPKKGQDPGRQHILLALKHNQHH